MQANGECQVWVSALSELYRCDRCHPMGKISRRLILQKVKCNDHELIDLLFRYSRSHSGDMESFTSKVNSGQALLEHLPGI